MADTLARPQRCSKCGTLSRKVVTLGDRYVCIQDACLTAAVQETAARLGRPPLKGAFLTRTLANIREELG